jgi:hypothetical protein
MYEYPCKSFRRLMNCSSFSYLQDVALAALYVSTKEHDTLKKPRELLAVSYAVRFPELAAKSKHPGGEIDLDTMDPTVSVSMRFRYMQVLSHAQIVEADRQRLLAIERLILETICFNFTARMPFPYVIKLGKEFRGLPQLYHICWNELKLASQHRSPWSNWHGGFVSTVIAHFCHSYTHLTLWRWEVSSWPPCCFRLSNQLHIPRMVKSRIST